ncbi:RNA-binding protein 42 isoform X2 [Struthio camelus]|uniref:RNA-binding protein 42 isoform X2 n=1 Tax=Struthio camelus TaxID=8801 RepID=UPI003603E258
MEAEMALFEQEVLGAPTPLPAGPPVVEAVALAVPPVAPVLRPIIATNTYQQVQQSLEARAAAAATVVTPIVAPPAVPFVGPAVPPQRPPVLRPTFVPHVLQRAAGPRALALRPPPGAMVAPPLAGPPAPPLLMAPPLQRPPGPPLAPLGPLRPGTPVGPGVPVGPLPPLVPVARTVLAAPKLNPTVIQAAPTVYAAPPAKRAEEEAREARPPGPGQAKGPDDGAALIGPSRPEPEPGPPEPRGPPGLRGPDPGPAPGPAPAPTPARPRRLRLADPPFLAPEVGPEPAAEDKKKGRPERLKRCIRTAAGSSWEDPSLLEWDADDFRIFCGDLGNEVNDDILARAFGRYPSFLKAKVIRDKRTGKTKGYGFVSFKDPNDYVRAMREMNGKYVGSRPIKLRKSMWKDRNLDVVRKKLREKKKLGLR